MELNYLYNIVEKENIKIYDWHLDNAKGLFMNYNNINAIALNYTQLTTEIEEKCTLAEELGHYYMDATYPATTIDKTLIDKQEYRAKKWRIKTLIPAQQLSQLLEQGFSYSYEIAEELGVTEDLVQDAYLYYRENNMIKCY